MLITVKNIPILELVHSEGEMLRYAPLYWGPGQKYRDYSVVPLCLEEPQQWLKVAHYILSAIASAM
jgi:hypothetical protein